MRGYQPHARPIVAEAGGLSSHWSQAICCQDGYVDDSIATGRPETWTTMRVALVLAVASVMCTGCGSGWPVQLGATDSGGNSGSAPEAPLSRAVVGRYTMSGRVVSLPGRPVRVCAPETVILVARLGETDIMDCQLGVSAVGVDMGRLQHRREFGGAVEGWASVTGRWDGSTLHVEQQADPQEPQPVALPQTPPCATPAGGWPTVVENENLNSEAVTRFIQTHPGTHAARLRPSPREALWLITTPDVEDADADLSPVYGKGLCVVRSAYRVADYRAAADAFPFDAGLGIFGSSVGPPDADGQWRVTHRVLYVTDELLDRQRALPDGLVRLEPAMRRL